MLGNVNGPRESNPYSPNMRDVDPLLGQTDVENAPYRDIARSDNEVSGVGHTMRGFS
jgi:hypothetical protein